MNRAAKQSIVLIIIIATALCLAPLPLWAADEEGSGLKAETLTIRVGYFGGPFYEKKVFSADELWGLNVVYEDYTYIDAMPSVVIDHVAGVRLDDLVAAAGIDPGSVQQFHFWTKDKASGYYTSFRRTELLDTPRYCYYSLPESFSIDEGLSGLDTAQAGADARPVPTVIALADDWNRVLAGAEFGSSYQNMDTNTRYRLIFGQSGPAEQAASRSAKWIHAIEVVLGGAPTLTMDASVLELEVGSVFRAVPQISAADPVIAANAAIVWSSSDPAVASVDAQGNITVRREGAAVITASLGDASASVAVNGVPGAGRNQSEGTDTNTNAAETSESETNESETAATAPESPAVTPVEAVPVQEVGSVSPVAPATVTENQLGGVQNWRVYEMSVTAVEMPVIEENRPLLRVTAGVMAGLFLLGFLWRWQRYRLDIQNS
jgi:hypothetical protein